MEEWQKILRQSIDSAEALSERFNIPLYDLQKVISIFPFKITQHYFNLIKTKNDALYKQVIPDVRELDDHGLFLDPLAEDRDSPVENIVHRYPDRCLFLISAECAGYCRFCTRKRKVSDTEKISHKHIENGIRYIRDHTEIRDVILSGGDPLILSDAILESILQALRKINHVEILRIGTRVPCFLPQRITNSLIEMLRKYHPLYMNVHFNHPDEFSDDTVRALGLLADAGIPLGNQTVLLKGVNDNPETMKKLMHKLLLCRVRPYYIYQADMVFGTDHFRTSVQKGIQIIKSLRGWTSGLAVPHYVIDAPNGGGKIPLLPKYIQVMNDREILMKNYQNKIYRYSMSKNPVSICPADK